MAFRVHGIRAIPAFAVPVLGGLTLRLLALAAGLGCPVAVSQGSQASPATATQPAAPKPAESRHAAPKHAGPQCVAAEEAVKTPNKEVCVSAHVYAVVELPDGTRFLDVCPPDVPDEQCRFTLITLAEDQEDVGDLRRYRDRNVNVRGVVRATYGRMGIVISHERQFRGGPEKFKPNPKLLREFNGQSGRMPVRDPNLASSGRHRSFMNTADKEAIPARR